LVIFFQLILIGIPTLQLFPLEKPLGPIPQDETSSVEQHAREETLLGQGTVSVRLNHSHSEKHRE